MPQLLSLSSRAHKPQLLSPHAATTEAHAPRVRALQQEKPPQREAGALQLEKARAPQRTPNTDKNKINKISKFFFKKPILGGCQR